MHQNCPLLAAPTISYQPTSHSAAGVPKPLFKSLPAAAAMHRHPKNCRKKAPRSREATDLLN
jgi:hypothetical protein